MSSRTTRPAAAATDVEAHIESVPDEGRRADCRALAETMRAATGRAPRLWPGGLVGFGSYHYRYASGREGDAPVIAFAPRRHETVVYTVPDIPDFEMLVQRLGSVRSGQACVYLRRLADVDAAALRALVDASVAAAAPQRTE